MPLRIYYGIEPRCDLACPYCGPRDLHSRMRPAGASAEDFILRQISDAGSFQVQLTGGEIAVRGSHLLDTVRKTGELGLAVILSTNGVWKCVDDRPAFLQGLSVAGNVIQTKVSIEGTRETHERLRGKGTYDATVRTLAELSEYGLNPRINATILRSTCTLENLEHLVSLAATYRAGLQTIPIRPAGRANEMTEEMPERRQLLAYLQHAAKLREETRVSISYNFDLFTGSTDVPVFDLYHPISCGAPLIGVHVSHTGEVYPCGFVQAVKNFQDFCAGVISQETSLLDIWQKSIVLERIRSAGKSHECNICEYYGNACWGGCWVVSHAMTGNLTARDPYCIKDLLERT